MFEFTSETSEKRELFFPIEDKIKRHFEKEKKYDNLTELILFTKNIASKLVKAKLISKRENFTCVVGNIDLTLFSTNEKMYLAIKKTDEDTLLMFTNWDFGELKEFK
jgi:hypothetical protein